MSRSNGRMGWSSFAIGLFVGARGLEGPGERLLQQILQPRQQIASPVDLEVAANLVEVLPAVIDDPAGP